MPGLPFSRFALTFDKLGFASEEQTRKTKVFRFVLLSACTNFAQDKIIMRILRFSFILLLCLMGWSAAHAQLAFEESALKMGQVEWLSETTVCVMVRNKASKPITITDVRTSSGQLKAEWSKEAIAPDGSAQIQLTYKADLLGHYEKAVHVYTDE